MRKKTRIAIEFLMTYGWAILLVVVVIWILYTTGVFKECRWAGLQAKDFPLSEVKVNPLKLTTTELVFELYYQQAGDATFVSAEIFPISTGGKSVTIQNISVSTQTFNQSYPTVITTRLSGFNGGECAEFNLRLTFRKPGDVTYNLISGKISGFVG